MSDLPASAGEATLVLSPAAAQSSPEATVQALGVKPDSVDIVITEVARTHWATGGVLWSERKPGT